MMNICESTQGALYEKQRKWFIRCGQKGNESWKEIGQCSFMINKLSALEWASKLTLRFIRNTVSLYHSSWGKLSAKMADSGAGKGGWRKPMLHCNDADTDLCLARK
ncbi:hypothetical protein [Shewanella benthica]|uniref:hypothetical protein n=1 Tax=Shewanella benthica TaxID=43661 RepID=UPI0015598571|nr:hypothetical protein [Shewanella benthica]